MTYARLRLVVALSLVQIAGCAPVDPGEIAATEEALTSCHTTFVEGVDVASFQGTINWTQVHNSGRGFAIARIGDGTYSDPTFHTNYTGIHAAGMVRGSYLFWRPTVGAATQAAAIADAVGTLGVGDLPVTIDVECMCPYRADGACGSGTAGCSNISAARTGLDDLIARVTTATGRAPMIYTGAWFWDGNPYLAGQVTESALPLWISDYGTSHYNANCANLATGWSDWHFWQYSSGCPTCPDRSAIPGISGTSIDRDRWNGDLASLMAFTGGGHPIYGGHYVMQSFPLASDGALQIAQGASAAAWIELRNTGTADWDENTKLATTIDRDRTSMFQGADWPAGNRLARVPTGMTIAPGSSYRFMWTFTVPPGTPTGMYMEHFGLVEEGVAWFGDSGQGGPTDGTIQAIIEVTPGPDAGPTAVDASTARDAGMASMGDASPIGSDGSIAPAGDAGVVMARGISGGCGCSTAGGRSNHGAMLLMLGLVALVLARRRSV